APGVRTNFALASNGGTAISSSQYSAGFPVGSVINGDRKGLNVGSGGGWNDCTAGVYPDFLQIDFNGTKAIDEINVFTIQDNFSSPSEPTLADIFGQYGVTAFDIQYWNGSAWVTVPGGSVTGNNKVWTQVTFSAITTDKIRVQVNNSLANYSRLVEVEAWSNDAPGPTPTPTPTPLPRTNFALATNGGGASPSSQISGSYPASATNNGDRKGLNWGSGGGWNDGTAGVYPDFLEIDFNGTK